MKTKYKFIIWDWNGTLYDDLDISFGAINDMLAKRNMPPLDLATFLSYIDTPISRFYEKAFDLSKETFEDLVGEYYAIYREYAESLPVPAELAETVRLLKNVGTCQVVVSGYEHAELLHLMKKWGVDGCFDSISGSGDRNALPKTERVREMIKKHGFSEKDCVIVGDTDQEYNAAKALDIDCIMVGWGHQPREYIRSFGCPIAENYTSLKDLLLYE